jgi:endoglucanase
MFFKKLLMFLTTMMTIVSSSSSSSDIIKGISWFGFETENRNLMCLWKNDLDWNLAKLQELGFNSIRLPFSYQYIQEDVWWEMDKFFEKVQNYNLSVVLDYHRLENTHQSAKPYTNEISFDQFLYSWKVILERYKDNPNLIAVDIFNEYQSDNYIEWNNLARQIVSYIETNFPERFTYYVGGVSWGGDLHFVNLEDLSYSDRIRYSIHKYFFSDTEPLEERWDYSFGEHKLVVNVGEWGYVSSHPNEVAWAKRFVNWLESKNIRNTYFFTYSYNSQDTGGILWADCTTVDTDKMDLLHAFWRNDSIPIIEELNKYTATHLRRRLAHHK